MKKVSVVIPCYNCANTIEETLQSTYSQTYKNVEIIAIDDGSTDATWEILQRLKNENTSGIPLHIFNQENKGQTITRNNGAKKAIGSYLLFLDSDDIIANTYLEKCVEAFNQNSSLKIVYAKANLFGAVNREWELKKFNLQDFLLENCIYITALIKTEDFNKVGGFDESLNFYEDWELWVQLINTNNDVYQIPEILFNYRIHDDKSSITGKGISNTQLLSKNRLIIYLKHIEKYNKNGLSFEEIYQKSKFFKSYYLKYYNVWYRKYFYKFFKPKKYAEIFTAVILFYDVNLPY